MPEKPPRIVLESDVFALTDKANKELHGSGTALSPAELEVLVLVDGTSTVGETASRARTPDKKAVLDIFGGLLRGGLIQHATEQEVSLDFIDFFSTKETATASTMATAQAKKQAAATALLLQQKGYSARIARRAKNAKPIDPGRPLSVLVIEDEPHLAALLKHTLTAEGFQVRTAANREEIVYEFRQPPRPDLVLLDVVLPNTNGFDILLKMRQHPVLMAIPVVMLTAQTTREAVLRGLAGGADGYITKPFRIEVLAKAVASVLGLPGHEDQADDAQDPWSL